MEKQKNTRTNDPLIRKVGFFTTESESHAKVVGELESALTGTETTTGPEVLPKQVVSSKVESSSEIAPLTITPSSSKPIPEQHIAYSTALNVKTKATGSQADVKGQISKSPASSGGSLTPTSQAPSVKVGSVALGEKKGSGAPKPKSTKAERRALQEAQRAAKSAGAPKPLPKKELEKKAPQGPQVQEKKPSTLPAVTSTAEDDSKSGKGKKKPQPPDDPEIRKRLEMFKHLPLWQNKSLLPELEAKFLSKENSGIHPAIFELGLKFLHGDILEGNARTEAMLRALKVMIEEYSPPPEKTFDRDLVSRINSQVSFLISCRPLSAGMGTAIRVLKNRVTKSQKGISEAEAKAAITQEIDRFIQEKLILAGQEICRQGLEKIRQRGEVLLTFGASEAVEKIFRAAFEQSRSFRVIVVDSRPELEGKEMLRRLVNCGISCTYARLNAASYLMPEVTKVFLGASAVHSNGSVKARVGSATVAMIAHSLNIPVLVCCETIKFHEKAQLNSITTNEEGNPNDLVVVPGREDVNGLKDWTDVDNLQVLNLKYDVMPPDYVATIICEVGMVPPTSVAAILREYRKDPTFLMD